MLWIFFADMSGDGLSKHGHPITAGMKLAETREPESPQSCVDAHDRWL